MEILALIPARGGSLGIPHKNITPLLGKPLIEYTIEALLACSTKLVIAVSTDSTMIAEHCRKYAQVAIIPRPPSISDHESSTESALLHALAWFKENKNRSFSYILTAQPTSPIRRNGTIDNFIASFLKKSDTYNAQLSLNADHTDFWIKNANDEFERLFPDAKRRRQDRTPIYAENSSLYITEVTTLLETKSILGSKCCGFELSKQESVDINEPIDILLAELYLKDREQVHEKTDT